MELSLALLVGCWLVGLAAEARPEDAPRNLADWQVTRPPVYPSDQWSLANHDFGRNWVVTLEAGQPVVALQTSAPAPSPLPFAIDHAADDYQFAGKQTATRVADGWVASFNKGEFGGSVWWFAPDGRQRYRIAEENIEGFVPTVAGLLMLEGLAHGLADEGSLRRLVRGDDGRWTSQPFADLGDPPFVATLQGENQLLVVSNTRLSRVDLKTRRVEVLVADAFWLSLYPNSVVVDALGRVEIGMRRGVARLDGPRPAPKIEWLLPSRTVADEPRAPGCP